MAGPPTTDAAGGRSSGVQCDQGEKMKIDKRKKVVVHRKKKSVVHEGQNHTWMSKDRFGAKRLRNLADNLAPSKRAVIEAKSAFRAFLNVAPFRIPNELIDFIAGHITPRLREFKLRKNQMVFTKDMVRKVFGVRCGNKPIKFANAEAAVDDLRVLYKAGTKRAELATAIGILKKCSEDDEATIIRTWDLICLATVVAPKSSNHISLEYLCCMIDPTRTEEYAWDEHILELAMETVTHIEKKKKQVVPPDSKNFEFWITGPFVLLGIAYMDHLAFPPSDHNFNKSLPRICSVCTSDFLFVIENDRDRKVLLNTTVFGRRDFLPLSKTPYGTPQVDDHFNEPPPAEEPEVNASASLNDWLNFPSSQDLEIPPRYKQLYDKHKALFDADVDGTMKNLTAGIKRMQSQRMAALLVDLDAANKQGAGPSVVFPAHDDISDDDVEEKDKEYEDSESEDDEEDSDAAEEDDEQFVAADAGAAKDAKVPRSSAHLDVPQTAVILDSLTTGSGDVEEPAVVSPRRSPRKDISDEAWNNAPDKPSFDLFEPGTAEYDDFNMSQTIPSVKTNDAPTAAALTSSEKVEAAAPSLVEPATPVDQTAAALTSSEKVEAAALEPATLVDQTAAALTSSEKVEAAALEPATPVDQIQHGAVTIKGKEDASSGFLTHDRKNRFKRAAKEDITPPKLKKIKVSKDVDNFYSTFVMNGRKLKSFPKDRVTPPFVEIGRYYTGYKAFQASLKPRQNLDSEVMNVWIEKFNHESSIVCKKTSRQKRKYSFSQCFVSKLIVDPKQFNAKSCMDELKQENAKYKILKCDLVYFPIVKNNHWAVPCINFVAKQLHIFDSIRGGKNASLVDQCARHLFENFAELVKQAELANNIDFDSFMLSTPDHPQQTTIFDCGFFSILFMENFSGKTMAEFDNNSIPDLRKVLAADLIEARTNKEPVEKLMEVELQKKRS